MTLRQAKNAVVRGANLLDEKVPDWYKKINVATLDLSDGWHCIVGQLNKDGSISKDDSEGTNYYSNPALRNLGIDTDIWDEKYNINCSARFGFYIVSSDYEINWDTLTHLWEEEIEIRIKAAS